MGNIVIELTNRCNLACKHCFSGRHGGSDDLPVDILDAVLREAKPLGFDRISFTGGDPTVHPRFGEILGRAHDAAYRFGIVTNGWNFTSVYPQVLARRESLSVVTFSLDGATRETHDWMRGAGSFRRVLSAFSICVVERLPFTINMVVTSRNRHELQEAAVLAADLGSRGLRFGHLMPTAQTVHLGLDLTPLERKAAEGEIRRLATASPIPIAIAPGFHTSELFPCDPLRMREVNIDCRGNLTKCCHLSGQGDAAGRTDIAGNLRSVGFRDGLLQLTEANDRFRARKQRRLEDGSLSDTDMFPCWYCSLDHRKVDWLKQPPGQAWSDPSNAEPARDFVPWQKLIPAKEGAR